LTRFLVGFIFDGGDVLTGFLVAFLAFVGGTAVLDAEEAASMTTVNS
jgi:NAD(P)H-hydrate repair Nnr-like enzyme with NAD(P)H-hydrate dehydratase domain